MKKPAIAIGAAIAALFLWRSFRSGGQLVPSVTTSEGFDLSPYGGPVVYPESVKQVARAIARAEGFYTPGSIPARAHNPGDIKVIGWTGQTLGEGITVFASDDAGWTALYKQLWLILTGQSGVYNNDMTIREMAAKWTGGDNASGWASNVAAALSVPDTSYLWEILA